MTDGGSRICMHHTTFRVHKAILYRIDRFRSSKVTKIETRNHRYTCYYHSRMEIRHTETEITAPYLFGNRAQPMVTKYAVHCTSCCTEAEEEKKASAIHLSSRRGTRRPILSWCAGFECVVLQPRRSNGPDFSVCHNLEGRSRIETE